MIELRKFFSSRKWAKQNKSMKRILCFGYILRWPISTANIVMVIETAFDPISLATSYRKFACFVKFCFVDVVDLYFLELLKLKLKTLKTQNGQSL